MKRTLIAIASLLLAITFTFPNIALLLSIALIAYNKYVAMVFCFIFAWNVAKLVEPRYRKHLEKKDGNKH